ncbi:MAG: hypothetical protein OXI43_13500 [Candidatus Poribacteria bacterium]|nr:hypothetical protein [Candidatus Poribacteria bacterium]
MNRKTYWGLGILATLIISFGAFVFYGQYTQMQQLKQITEQNKKELEPKEKPVTKVNRKPTDNKQDNTPQETIPDPLAGLTWQERTDKLYPALKLSSLDWENLTDNEIVTLLNRKEQWNSITQDQRDTVVREFYKRALGKMPPPEGHFYVCNPDGSVKLGEDGLPIYYKHGEPVFKIKTMIGFRPTREQIIIHKTLLDLYEDAVNRDDQETAEMVDSEIQALEEHAVGEIPLITASTQSPGGVNRSEWRRKLSERAREEYRKMGIEYVYDYTSKGIY